MTSPGLAVRIVGVVPTGDESAVQQLDVVVEDHNLTLDQARAAVQAGVIWPAELPPDVHLKPAELKFEVTEVEGPSDIDNADMEDEPNGPNPWALDASMTVDIPKTMLPEGAGPGPYRLIPEHVWEILEGSGALKPRLEMSVPESVNPSRQPRVGTKSTHRPDWLDRMLARFRWRR